MLVLIALSACGNRTAEEERFVISQENGVTVATTHGGALYPSPVIRFEPEMILREDPENVESLLTSPTLFTQGSDGRFYVPGRRSGDIAVFNADGSYLRRIGQAGEGPGDFISVGVPVFSGDRMAVWDFQQQRTTYFSMEYALLEVVRSPVNTLVVNLRLDREGRYCGSIVKAGTSCAMSPAARSTTGPPPARVSPSFRPTAIP
jgi:hypothetical protein